MFDLQLESIAPVLAILIGIHLVLSLFVKILTHLQSRAMQRFWRGAKRLFGWAQREVASAIHDPVEYPRLSRVADYVMMSISYIYAFYFGLICVYFALLLGLKGPDLPLVNQLGLAVFMLLWAVCVMIFKADGNRRRLSLRSTRDGRAR